MAFQKREKTSSLPYRSVPQRWRGPDRTCPIQCSQVARIEVRRTLRVVCKPSLGMKVAMSRKTSMLAAPRSPITSRCHSDTGASKFMLSVTGRGASYCAVIWAGVRAAPIVDSTTLTRSSSSSSPPK